MSDAEVKAELPPKVDLVLVFRSGLAHSNSKYTTKQEIKENAEASQAEYERLLSKLKGAGLHATGRRGQKNGQVLVLIWAPSSKVVRLIQRERQVLLICYKCYPQTVPLLQLTLSVQTFRLPSRTALLFGYLYDGGCDVRTWISCRRRSSTAHS